MSNSKLKKYIFLTILLISDQEETRDFTERETERLLFVTERSSVKDGDKAKGEKNKEEDDDEDEEGGRVKRVVEPPDVVLYRRYKELEEQVLEKLGISKARQDSSRLQVDDRQ